MLKKDIFPLYKEENMLCGDACIYSIKKSLGLKYYYDIKLSSFWITDIALNLLKSFNFKVEVLVYNSNLYNDYLKEKNIEFSGFISINKFIKAGGNLKEKPLSKEVFIKEIDENLLIVCLDSAKFNNDKNMEGGHYIIVNDLISKDYCNIINPKKNSIDFEKTSINHILKCMSGYGSWRICIKRNTNKKILK